MIRDPIEKNAVDAKRSRSARRRWSDLIWGAAPLVSGITGVAGFAMLIAEVFSWSITGGWSARPARDVLKLLGLVGENLAAPLGILGSIPLSLMLIATAPCLFLTMIRIGERVEGRFLHDD